MLRTLAPWLWFVIGWAMTEKTTTGKSAKSSSAADPKPAPPPDAIALKLASDPRFVVIKPSGKGFVNGGHSPAARPIVRRFVAPPSA
jgi:hypothetical protein